MSLVNSIKSAVNFLDNQQEIQLVLDAISTCQHIANPNFRVAVFGPFNHGKSTLLNALLGTNALPIALIPTTGAAISVKYGEPLQTHITFLDGTKVSESGTDILQRFAVLDGERRMRDNVASVEVICPHSLLKNGTELLDLPGTNDREEQDNLVRNQLLTADLVIQVLDARKLFTLKEVENLRDWLLDRGIKTVIFVINFLNLLDIEEQKEVVKRARSIAGDFRLDLPNKFSNLYRVDALPALKARLKGDIEAAHSSGIFTFESALQNILAVLSEQVDRIRLPRVVAIADQIKQSLEIQAQELKNELRIIDRERNAEIKQRRQEAEQLKKAFDTTLQNIIDWIDPEKLVERYQSECFQVLCEDKLADWLNDMLTNALVERFEAADKWVNKACYTFNHDEPDEVQVSLPDFPEIDIPNRPSELDEPSDAGWAAVGGGLIGSIFGPWGAAAGAAWAYSVTKESAEKKKEEVEANYRSQVLVACNTAIESYLRSFSNAVMSKIPEYRRSIKDVFIFKPPQESSEVRNKRKLLRELESALNALDREIEIRNIN